MSEAPRVFISWSKPKAKKVATILKEYLPLFVPGVEGFVSEHDISKGSRGLETISFNLEKAFFGVVCLSKENINSPWVNFEAGALSKHVSSDKVSPLLLDVEIADLGASPLAQFQATFTDKPDMKKLFESIALQSGLPHASDNLTVYLDKFWPELDEKLRVAIKRGSVLPEPSELTKTEKQLNEIARQLNGINYKISTPERLFPEEYIRHVLSSKGNLDSYLENVSAEKSNIKQRFEKLYNLTGEVYHAFDGLILTVEDIEKRLVEEDVPFEVQIDLAGEFSFLLSELSKCIGLMETEI